jgi:prepilin-type N-terminal cleavage/methylation domain-containing protein
MKIFNFKKHNSAGFTIIETMVAVTIFSIAITGVITIAAKGGINTYTAKNRLIATYLADEGIELTRGLRDTTVLRLGTPSALTAGWLRFANDVTVACSASNPCDIDGANYGGTSGTPFPQMVNVNSSCPVSTITGITGNYCPLYYDTDTGYYNNMGRVGSLGTPGASTTFNRSSVVTWSSNPNELKVVTTVTWTEGGAGKSLTQTENLFNWYAL